MKFRVLIVPGKIDGSLNIAEEMLRLANLGNNSDKLYVETITPQRSKEIDIVSLLQRSKFDCIHLLGHSDGDTFELASGDILTDDHILALCKDAEAKVLFLNACSSAALCQYAVNTTIAVALAWVGPVVDDDAIVAALRFYNAIAGFGEPWGSGLRRAYEAVGEKRRLLWLTDGEYVSNMIAPIIARLDRFDQERKDAFGMFGGKLDSILDRIANMSQSVSSSLAKVTESYSKLRVLLYAIAIMVVVALLVLAYTFMAQAQTIPPLTVLPPGCSASGDQPSKCNTDTPIPPTAPPITDTPAPLPTDTPVPPTDTLTPLPTDTPVPRPTRTKEEPTSTPEPTDTPLPTVELPTLTPTETELPPCQP